MRKASPLSLTKIEQQDKQGLYYELVLYYQTTNLRLGRVKGIFREGDINWLKPVTDPDAPHLDRTTMISVVTSEKINYVYYIPAGESQYNRCGLERRRILNTFILVLFLFLYDEGGTYYSTIELEGYLTS